MIDPRTIPAHSPAIVQNELGIGDLPHLGNIVVFEHVFAFPESCRYSNLISYADLHRRGNEHVPFSLGGRFELPGPPGSSRHARALRFRNLFAHALPTPLENLGHHAVHMLDIELAGGDDLAIWAYAAENGPLRQRPVGKELSSRRQSVDAQESSSYK